MHGTEKAPASPTRTPQQPHGQVMVFGLRQGVMVHVVEVPNGITCGCICAACRDPLVAVNKVTKQVAHFRHISGAECASGYETALHLAGKDALLRLKRVTLPDLSKTVYRQASDGKIFEEKITGDGHQLLQADQAQEEVWDDLQFRPDVVLEAQGHKLYVEIRVTHAVDEAKRAKIKARGISSIEIDLSRVSPSVLLDQATFDAFLTTAPEIRSWLYSRKQAKLEANALRRLEQTIASYEPQVEDRRAAEKAKARHAKQLGSARQQQQVEAASLRASIRSTLTPHLEQLQLSQDDQRIAARELQLAQRHPMTRVEHYRSCGTSDLFARVKGHWAFKASHEQWQAFVLDQLFPADGKQPRRVDSTSIEHAVATQFGVANFVAAIYAALDGRPYNTVLTRTELLALPHPKAVITRYLMHLHKLGILLQLGTSTIFSPMASTLEQANQAEQDRKAASRRAHDRRAGSAEYLQQMRHRPTPKMEPQIAERVLAILASERFVYEHHQGQGARCSDCWMALPADHDGACPFCQSTAIPQPVAINLERLTEARIILPRSPGVARSLTSIPELANLGSLQPIMDRILAEW